MVHGLQKSLCVWSVHGTHWVQGSGTRDTMASRDTGGLGYWGSMGPGVPGVPEGQGSRIPGVSGTRYQVLGFRDTRRSKSAGVRLLEGQKYQVYGVPKWVQVYQRG